jgi:hypothetical protein
LYVKYLFENLIRLEIVLSYHGMKKKQGFLSRLKQALDDDKPTPFGSPTYCPYCKIIMLGRGVDPKLTIKAHVIYPSMRRGVEGYCTNTMDRKPGGK